MRLHEKYGLRHTSLVATIGGIARCNVFSECAELTNVCRQKIPRSLSEMSDPWL